MEEVVKTRRKEGLAEKAIRTWVITRITYSTYVSPWLAPVTYVSTLTFIVDKLIGLPKWLPVQYFIVAIMILGYTGIYILGYLLIIKYKFYNYDQAVSTESNKYLYQSYDGKERVQWNIWLDQNHAIEAMLRFQTKQANISGIDPTELKQAVERLKEYDVKVESILNAEYKTTEAKG